MDSLITFSLFIPQKEELKYLKEEFTPTKDKVGIVAVVSDDLIKEKKLSAGNIVGELAKLVGGGGGGRPHLATSGGKDVSGIPAAISKVEKIVGSLL